MNSRTIWWIIVFIIFLMRPQLLFFALLLYFIYTILQLVIKIPDIKDFLERNSILKKKTDGWRPKFGDKIVYSNTSSSSNLKNKMNELQFKKSHFLYIIIALVFSFIVIDGLVSVPPGYVAVIYDRGRGVLETTMDPGLHLKIPFWQKTTLMDTRIQEYTMSITTTEGAQYGNDTILVYTKDGQNISLDVTVLFKINAEDTPWILSNIGEEKEYLEKVIRPFTQKVVRDVSPNYTSIQYFSGETLLKVQEAMTKSLINLTKDKKIIIQEVLARNIGFSANYLEAIELKQITQQKIDQSKLEKQQAVVEKETKIINAEAEAEAIRLKGESLKANPLVIQFEFVQKISPSINWGILPDNIIPMINMPNIKAN